MRAIVLILLQSTHLQPLANDRLRIVLPDLEVWRALGRGGQRRHHDLWASVARR